MKIHKTSDKLFPLSSCGRVVYSIINADLEVSCSKFWKKVTCKRCLQRKGKIDNRETTVNFITTTTLSRKIIIRTEITQSDNETRKGWS